MLKWIGVGRADHPMADFKEARKLIAELPRDAPLKALEEVTHWIESVAGTEGFQVADRVERLRLLDEAAQPFARRMTREYLTDTRLTSFQENRLWKAITGFWTALAEAYLAAIGAYEGGAKGAGDLRPQLALTLSRALRALSQQLKWLQARYHPVNPVLWKSLSRLYTRADTERVARQKTEFYPGVPGESSPEAEFLKTVMLWISAPDNLPPLKLEIAERLTAHFASRFGLSRSPSAGATHCFDLAGNGPPARVGAKPQEMPGRLFFGAGEALGALRSVAARVEKTGVPPEINLGGGYDPSTVLDVMVHLERHWSAPPPQRQAQRHAISAPLRVVLGYDALLETLLGLGDIFSNETQLWNAQDISAGGISAVAPRDGAERLRVGSILGLQPEGGSGRWGVGMVRRVSAADQGTANVGVQTLARQGRVVTVRPPASDSLLGRPLADPEQAIFLMDGHPQGQARLVFKPGGYAPGQSLETELDGTIFLLLPMELEERGEDFDLGRYRAMERSASEEV